METLENIPDQSRITLLKSTIKVQEKIIQALEERIELLKQNHKLEIKNYFVKRDKNILIERPVCECPK